jgi:hypothetical protein
VGFDGVDEVLGVGFREVFHAKVVNTEDECGAFCAVAPEAWCERHGGVAVGGELLDELVECDNGSLFEAVHTAAYFEVDKTVGGDLDVVAVIVPDFLWNDGRLDTHVLEIGHGGSEEIVFDVETKVTGAVFGVRNCAVEVEFGVEHGDGWGAGIAGIVEFVTAGGHADAMGLFFLWTNITDKVGVSNFTVPRDGGFGNEEKSARAVDNVGERAFTA